MVSPALSESTPPPQQQIEQLIGSLIIANTNVQYQLTQAQQQIVDLKKQLEDTKKPPAESPAK